MSALMTLIVMLTESSVLPDLRLCNRRADCGRFSCDPRATRSFPVMRAATHPGPPATDPLRSSLEGNRRPACSEIGSSEFACTAGAEHRIRSLGELCDLDRIGAARAAEVAAML